MFLLAAGEAEHEETNAAKHGGGIITVRLEEPPEGGHLLSVCNEGPPLPEGFDPAASKGLGMKIVQALVEQIGHHAQQRGVHPVGPRTRAFPVHGGHAPRRRRHRVVQRPVATSAATGNVAA